MDRDRDRPSRRSVAHSNLRSKNRQAVSPSVRTTNYETRPAVLQPAQTRQTYPLPISKDKEARALVLYMEYCDAVFNEKAATGQQLPGTASRLDGYHLSVPGPPTAQSTTSYASSHLSQPKSSYDNKTDLSSVVSFGDEIEPTPAIRRAEAGMRSFDGKMVKQRRRKKLDPVARAKAALIRHLGSCSVCNLRRVKVKLPDLVARGFGPDWMPSALSSTTILPCSKDFAESVWNRNDLEVIGVPLLPSQTPHNKLLYGH